MNYSENSSDVHYADTSTPTQPIKQEVESGPPPPNEEAYAPPHNLVGEKVLLKNKIMNQGD